MQNIIFDLDGTLIDSKLRLYELFQRLVPTSTFSYNDYWERKQNKLTHEIILRDEFNYSQEEIIQFIEEWMSLIETKDFLQLDTVFAGIHHFLLNLKPYANLYLCTARRNSLAAYAQLKRLKLDSLFNDVLIAGEKPKEFLIKESIQNLSSNDWMIGDTGKDIETGKRLHLKTCAVLSGFLNEQKLRAYKPDYIFPSVINFDISLISGKQV